MLYLIYYMQVRIAKTKLSRISRCETRYSVYLFYYAELEQQYKY